MKNAPRPHRRLNSRAANAAELPTIGELFDKAGFSMNDQPPESALIYRDLTGAVRRVIAMWSDGWRATLFLRKDGSHSLRFQLKFRAAVAR